MQPPSTRSIAEKIVRYELLWLLLVAPFLLFPGSYRVLATAAVPALWLLRYRCHGRFITRTPLDWPIVGLLFMAAVSLLITPIMALSLPKVTGLVLSIAVYYAILEHLREGAGAGRLLAGGLGIIALAAGISVIGLVVTNWSHKFQLLNRIASTLPHVGLSFLGMPEGGLNPNYLAGPLLFAFPLAATLAWYYRKRPFFTTGLIGRLAYLGCFLATLLIGIVILLTQSRGAYLAVLLAFGAVMVLPRPVLRRILGGVTAALCLALFLYAAIVQPGIAINNATGEIATPGEGIHTLEARLEIWSRALVGVQDFPFTGMGIGTFREVVHILYPLFLIPSSIDLGHAHNHLLTAAVDLGVPGLIAYLALWINAAWMCWQVWRYAPQDDHRILALGLGTGMIAHFGWGIFDTIPLGSKGGLLFWLMLAAIAGLHHITMMTPDTGPAVTASGQTRPESFDCR